MTMKVTDAAILLGITDREMIGLARSHPDLISIQPDGDVYIAPNAAQRVWHAARVVREVPFKVHTRKADGGYSTTPPHPIS
jgi:hypothetical protein